MNTINDLLRIDLDSKKDKEDLIPIEFQKNLKINIRDPS